MRTRRPSLFDCTNPHEESLPRNRLVSISLEQSNMVAVCEKVQHLAQNILQLPRTMSDLACQPPNMA